MEKHSESFYKIFRHEGLKFGWAHAKKHFWFFFQLFLLMVIVGTLPNLWNNLMGRPADAHNIVSVICWVLSLIFTFGFIKVMLHFVHGKAHSISDLWNHNWTRVIWWLLARVITTVLTIVGLCLLLIPGIYVAARLYLYDYFVVDQNMNAIEAISASREVTKGHVWEIIGIGLLTAGINILGMIPIGIGLLWTIPTVRLAKATLYKKLTAHAHHIE